MTRRDEIIKDAETDAGIECDVNADFDVQCDGDTCLNVDCECWDDLRREVENHLEDNKNTLRLRGSLTVWELRNALLHARCSVDDPVFINGEPIYEAWSGGTEFHITTSDSYTAKHAGDTDALVNHFGDVAEALQKISISEVAK